MSSTARPGAPWREDDPTGPLGVYGASQARRRAGGGRRRRPTTSILRTAWVFSAHGANFVKTMLRVGQGKPEMRVVGDQSGGPTAARDIAGALWTIAEAWTAGNGKPGIFHYAGAPACTWADFAEAIFARSGWSDRPAVTRIATADWPTKAVRPANSVLDCTKIAGAYGIAQPDWRAGARRGHRRAGGSRGMSIPVPVLAAAGTTSRICPSTNPRAPACPRQARLRRTRQAGARGLQADGCCPTPLGLRARALRPTNRREAMPRQGRFEVRTETGI